MRSFNLLKPFSRKNESSKASERVDIHQRIESGPLQGIVNAVHVKLLRWGLGVSMLAAAACSTNHQNPQKQDTDDAQIADTSDTANSDGSVVTDIKVIDSLQADIGEDSIYQDSEIGPAMAGDASWPDANFWPLEELENGNTLFENFPPGYIDPVSKIDEAARVAWEVPADMMPKENFNNNAIINSAPGIEAKLNDSSIFKHTEPGLRWAIAADFDNNGEDDVLLNGFTQPGIKQVPYISYSQDGVLQPLVAAPWLDDTLSATCHFAGNLDNDSKGRTDVICNVRPEFEPENWDVNKDGPYHELRAYYGTFQGPTNFWYTHLFSGNENLSTITAHDLNGDGFLDLAAINSLGLNEYNGQTPGSNFRIFMSDANPKNDDGAKQVMTFSEYMMDSGDSEPSFALASSATNLYSPIHSNGSLPMLTHLTDGAKPQSTFVFTPNAEGEVTVNNYSPFSDPSFDYLSFLHMLKTSLGELNLGSITKEQLDMLREGVELSFPELTLGSQQIGFADGGDADPMLQNVYDILGKLHVMQSHTGSYVPSVTSAYVDSSTGEYLHNHRLNFSTTLTSDGAAVTCWGGTEIPHGANNTAFLTSCGDEDDGMSASTDTVIHYMLGFMEAPVDDLFIPNYGTGALRVDVLGSDLTFDQTAGAWRAVKNPETNLAEVKWVDGKHTNVPGEFFDATTFAYNGDVYLIASHYQAPEGENGFRVFKTVQRGHRFWLAFDVKTLDGVPQDGRGAVVTVTANGANITRHAVIGASTHINGGNSMHTPTFFAMGDPSSTVESVNAKVCWPGGKVDPPCETFTNLPIEKFAYGTNPDEDHGPNNPYVIKK